MHKLTGSYDFSFLVSKELIQLCIGFNQVIMRFNGEISISVETPIRYFDSSGKKYIYEDNKLIGSEFVSLLGENISSVHFGSRVLKLLFDNDEIIELFEDEEAFESFHITIGGKVIAI